MRKSGAAVAVAILVMTAGCSVEQTSDDESNSSSGSTSRETETDESVVSDSETSASQSAPESTSDDPELLDQASTSDPVVTGGAQELTIAQALDAGSWEEAEHDPAATGMGSQRALGAELECDYGSDEGGEVIDFRLSDVTGELVVDVAQDVRSESTNGTVEFYIEVDGQKADVKNVEFKGKASLKASLDSVAVVKVGARQIEVDQTADCEGDVTAVITSLKVAEEQG